MAYITNRFYNQIDNINTQEQTLNQFYLSTWHTITELHKTNGYIKQLIAITSKINCLLDSYKKIKKSQLFYTGNKNCEEIIHKIFVEYQFLISTVEALNQFLEKMERNEGLNFEISGNMIDLKYQINDTIKKINKVLKT